MKVNLKEFDAKQFFLEKGEMVGLGVAVTLMVLMIMLSLFIPPNGFFSGSPVDKAKPMEDSTKRLLDTMASAQPSDNDKPGSTEGKLFALETHPLKVEPYETVAWYLPNSSDNPARRPPEVLPIDETRVVVAKPQISTYIFNRNFSSIMVLKGANDKADSGGGPGGGRTARLRGLQMPGMPAGGAGGGRNAARFNMPGMVGAVEDEQEYTPSFVPLEKLDPGARLARQPRPLRMAIIAGSFPFKAELEEFRSKLHLNSTQEVLSEMIDEGEKDKNPQDVKYAFRFNGVRVQRREVDGLGKPVGGAAGEWNELDLKSSYKIWVMLTGKEYEPDDPKFLAISFPGLVMPRLAQFRAEDAQAAGGKGMAGGPMPPGPRGDMNAPAPRADADSQYPAVEMDVPNIKKTLEELAASQTVKVVKPPSQFSTDAIDIFNPSAGEPADKQGMMPGAMTPKGGQPADGQAQEPFTPEHVPVRLIDVTIEPGKTYEYRLQVRMANPNYKRKDVASPQYAKDEELKTDKWTVVPEKVVVPPELIYYTVDQRELGAEDPKEEKDPNARKVPYTGINRYAQPRAGQEVAMQFHRWVDTTVVGKDAEPVFIGEWAIAERVIVPRGEYIGQPVTIELPVWKYTRMKWVIPGLPVPGERKRKPGMEVPFGYDDPAKGEAILVDFEGGKQSFEHLIPMGDENFRSQRVDDTSATEVLMLTPEGKLLGRNSADDIFDKERIQRRRAVRERIQDVKEPKGGAGSGTGLDPLRPRNQ
jgi:hypothetical protein